MKKMLVLLLFISYATVIGNSLMPITKLAYNKGEDVIEHTAYTTADIIRAIIREESSDGKYLYSSAKWENAVGVLQIRPIMVNHINNDILHQLVFTLDDRLDSVKSVYMFMIYQRKHNPDMDFETACRIWNGGQRGMNKTATIKYFKKVKKHIELMVNNN